MDELGPHVNEWVNMLKWVAKLAIMSFIIVAGILGNLLVILTVIRHRNLRKIKNSFVVSLAFADMLVAVMVMPFNISVQITERWLFGYIMCDMWNSMDVYFFTVSILHLCCISGERFFAIKYPLKHKVRMTKRPVCWMLLAAWVLPAAISFPPIFTGLYTTPEQRDFLRHHPDHCEFKVNTYYAFVSSSISFWIPCIFIVCMYWAIFKEVKRALALRNNAVGGTIMLPDVVGAPNQNAVTDREINRMRREHKMAKILRTVVVCFICCWSPFFIWYCLTANSAEALPYRDVVGTLVIWVGYSNSALNPVIYAYFHHDYREGFKDTLRWAFCSLCRRPPPDLGALGMQQMQHA